MAKKDKVVDIDDIVKAKDPKNARRHTDRNLSMIQSSITELGTGRSILLGRKKLIAGEGTVIAAQRAGIKKVRIIEAAPDELIAVKRDDLSPEQEARMALFDNHAGEHSEWDPAMLEQLAKDGVPMDGIFGQDELDALLEADDAAAVEPMTVARPTEVAWVLVAVPMSAWPQCQAAVETLQNQSVFSTMVLRPKETEKEGKAK